uniref:Uncharacterized protein n=1 Tax=Anguilla anguilla TaxID=7936 RepID=A0A0E9QV48_ANGAN
MSELEILYNVTLRTSSPFTVPSCSEPDIHLHRVYGWGLSGCLSEDSRACSGQDCCASSKRPDLSVEPEDFAQRC